MQQPPFDRVTQWLGNSPGAQMARQATPAIDPMNEWQAMNPTGYSNPNIDAATTIIQQAQQGNPKSQAAIKSADNFVPPGDVDGLKSYLNHIHDQPGEVDPSNPYQVMTAGARWLKESGYKRAAAQMPSPIQIAAQDAANVFSGKGSDMLGLEQEAARNLALTEKYQNSGLGGSGGGVTGFVYNKLRSAIEAAGLPIDPETEFDLVNIARNGLQKGATITIRGKKIAVENILGTEGMLEAQEAAKETGTQSVRREWEPGTEAAKVRETIGPAGQKSFAEQTGQVGGKALIDKRQTALDAQKGLIENQNARSLLDSGAVTGAGADFITNFGNALNTIGISMGEDAVSNTQAFIALRASAVGRKIKDFGAGTGLSDADREYAQKAAAGQIAMTEKAIRKILELDDLTSRQIMDSYGQELERIPQNMMPYDLSLPKMPISSDPLTQRLKASGYSDEQVMEYKKMKGL